MIELLAPGGFVLKLQRSADAQPALRRNPLSESSDGDWAWSVTRSEASIDGVSRAVAVIGHVRDVTDSWDRVNVPEVAIYVGASPARITSLDVLDGSPLSTAFEEACWVTLLPAGDRARIVLLLDSGNRHELDLARDAHQHFWPAELSLPSDRADDWSGYPA